MAAAAFSLRQTRGDQAIVQFSDLRPRPAAPTFWGGVLLCVLILTGSFYNLAHYPTIWWDEAIFSETAANLVQHGRYAFTVQSPKSWIRSEFRRAISVPAAPPSAN